MAETTTIKVTRDTHQRFSALARARHMSQPALLAELVEQAEEAEFWDAIDAIDPDEYEAATRAEGLPADDYSFEERLILDEEAGTGATAR